LLGEIGGSVMHTEMIDVAIIGGGIVGAATAMALTAGGELSVSVLEAENRLAPHQTGHNSGVIHAGLYYKPGSAKARLCVEGREAMYRFCHEHGVAHKRCGKIVVATREKELPHLEELERRGKANGLAGICRLTPEQIRQREPHASGLAGLWVPDTGIVDFFPVCEAMADVVRQRGGRIQTGTKLVDCRRETDCLVLETTNGLVRARHLVNCAGLQCDRVARMCGADPGVRIIPFRGEYYELREDRREMVRTLVYPVPDPDLPFLGAHFTRTIDNAVEVGPNAVLAFKREGYRRRDVRLADLLDMAVFPGFWRMARRQWSVGIGEQYRSLNKRAFIRSAQRLIPDLTPADVQPGGSGVRAQAVTRTGKLIDDFHIVRADRAIHVLNAPSPAATAAIAIGKQIATMAAEHFGTKKGSG